MRKRRRRVDEAHLSEGVEESRLRRVCVDEVDGCFGLSSSERFHDDPDLFQVVA